MHTSRFQKPSPRREAGLPLRRRLRGESGVAIVEFALVMPLLCFIVVLVLDFGRAFNYWIDTTHLASEGARLAAVDHVPSETVPGCTFTTVQTYIRCKADTVELRDGTSRWVTAPLDVCVTNPGTTSKVGDPVEVSVSTTYHFLPILNAGTINLEGTATMRREVLANHVSSGCG